MTVYKMVQSGSFTDKSILLLDENTKTNDRTWCFWKTNDSLLEQSISKNGFGFVCQRKLSQGFRLATVSLQYGERFDFTIVFDLLSTQENITFINQKVLEIERIRILIQTESESFSCSKLFNSIYNKKQKTRKYPVLQQHFIGWFIKSELYSIWSKPRFMDFR
jgi:lycopene beta-cyclase